MPTFISHLAKSNAPDLENTNLVVCRSTSCAKCERDCVQKATSELHDFQGPKEWTEKEIVEESRRCLYCVNAPCSISCTAKVDSKMMIHAAGERNFYHAAEIVLSANPLGMSTALLCECDDTCQGGCNLSETSCGSIKTNAIQLFSMRRFREYNIKQTRDPRIPERGSKIACIGAGPASLSAATFLARLGYQVTVFEKESFGGGLLMTEIPAFRLPAEDVQFEVELVKQLGVEFQFNKTLGIDFTMESLKAEGFEAIFVGIGNPDGIKYPFEMPIGASGVTDSHKFLRKTNNATKLKEYANHDEMPDLKGKRVIIIGAGDTAMDCAQVAKRCGAEHVSVAFRKQISDMRAARPRVHDVMKEDIELLPLIEPARVVLDGDVVSGMEFNINRKNREGKYEKTVQTMTVDADYIVCALGAKLTPENREKMAIPSEVDRDANQTKDDKMIFIGGDVFGSASVVEAVNDGRTAAAKIHNMISGEELSVMPGFHSDVNEVSLQTETCGMNFVNPFGLSSAPISCTYECIKRAFDAGLGWAVTKTMCLNKDIQPNNHVRIVKCDDSPSASCSYNNICMITEHTVEYWEATVRRLKAEYPDRILVVSIMCMDDKEDWQSLAKIMEAAGADGLELNLSCPNECHGEGGHNTGFDGDNKMAMALGVDEKAVERITRYVSEVVNVPVFTKLTPNVTEIADMAEAVVKGLDGRLGGISAINTVAGISKIMPSGHPFPQVGTERRTIYGGLSGDQVRPIAIRQISSIHRRTNAPILGIGGVRSAFTAMQLIHAGAQVLQICSSMQRFSYEIVSEMIAGFKFMLYSHSRPDLRGWINNTQEEAILPHGCHNWMTLSHEQDAKPATLKSQVSLANNYIGERADLEGIETWRVKAEINDNCLDCGSCASSCRDNGPGAIFITETGKFEVDPDLCIGCALCCSVCPAQAIEYKQLPGLNDLSEEERAKVTLGC
eukprot:TRINITY_DN2689_c0_g1_i1.p1 TRINITY_DN2689_c0_g1~~TRINITY_DN2689_c0_g1_i1.p1  ORF type:complete len:968 (-),score=352.64 TRINITY_DN2689_c0_g1_i1:398-3265(-)